jgi:type IV pilus assembly protein PilV
MRTTAAPRNQQGISMIEVLVAALILSFGITSIGMMMLSTLQSSRSVVLRTRAVELAQDMAERIRNNGLARAAYDTATTTPADNSCFPNDGAPAANCTPAALAAHDLWHWNQLLTSPSSGLPLPIATVAVTTATPPLYTITIQWLDGTAPAGETFTDRYILQVVL